MFNYYFFYDNILASHMETVTTVYNLLSIPSHQCLFLADIKYGYWVINIYSDNCYYLAFHILRLGQIQPNYMPQRAKTSSFTFSKLINIVLGLILSPNYNSYYFTAKPLRILLYLHFIWMTFLELL